MDLKVLREVIVKNLLIAFRIPVIVSMMILLLAVMIFPSAGLTAVEASKPIEMMVSFIGIVLMSAVYLPEQDKSVRESVACRKIGLETIQFIRLMISIVLIFLFVASFCLYLSFNECQITFYMVWGGILSAFFMGSITFSVAGISGNSINGIMAGMIYYICNYGLKKQLGVFYLFSMSQGTFAGKTWLLVGAITIIILKFAAKKEPFFLGIQ